MKIVTKLVLGSNKCLVKEPPQYGVFHADDVIDTPNKDIGRFIWTLDRVFHNVAYYKFKYVLFENDERYYLWPETFD